MKLTTMCSMCDILVYMAGMGEVLIRAEVIFNIFCENLYYKWVHRAAFKNRHQEHSISGMNLEVLYIH